MSSSPSFADFAIGLGENATWIGSLQGECYPSSFLSVPSLWLALTTIDENIFRAAVSDTLDGWRSQHHEQGHHQDPGWPWPWYTSHNSSWIITFDPEAEAVFVTVGGGVGWHRIAPHHSQFPEENDSLGPPDIVAWLRDPAAPPSVPMPLMREKTPMPGFGGEGR
ncbi:hypothetical protein [Amycolatopsis sp. PS_44_ISF1]|uniref:hypothetical protein n=1 Tax=Amycolatopsis sp. PS_44_ISF1 TaxID=2974917 RepID=UPI0028DE66C2|nr:hypothetical protein [Amycolatopsis sp. PS_44_ISF1]MDT8916051.1 hypothetical protein [Amycolatopsis sp. PS_44_ISF1]